MSKVTQRGIAQFNANKDKGLSWDEWQEKFPEGVEAMEETDPARFNAMYLDEFGVNPGGAGSNRPPVNEESKSKFTANVNANWTWDQWQENAPEGLEAMQQLDPNKFNALYKATFGVTVSL